jgi:HAMP domain-containing protein
MLAGVLLLEALSLALFAALLIHQQTHEVFERAQHRLAHQATSVALQAKEALLQERPKWVGLSVQMMGEAPSVAFAKVTDPAGNVIFVSAGEPEQHALEPLERAQIPLMTRDEPRVFNLGQDRWEGVRPIYTGSDLRGFAWVETDRNWDHEELTSILRGTVLFGAVWIVASCLLVLLMARSISGPLATLHRGTRALMDSPENSGNFPLPVSVHNEVGDLIETFNRMVVGLDAGQCADWAGFF